MTINREAAELMALRLTNAVDAAHTFAEALRLATVALQEPREVPEVEPGTAGTATVSGKRGVRVMRVQPDDRAERVYVWISDHTVGGMFAHADEDVTDFVPDPDTAALRAEVERLQAELYAERNAVETMAGLRKGIADWAAKQKARADSAEARLAEWRDLAAQTMAGHVQWQTALERIAEGAAAVTPKEPLDAGEDDEEFCRRCAAGVDSPEHHEKCVVGGWALDGESADSIAATWAEHPGPLGVVAADEQAAEGEAAVAPPTRERIAEALKNAYAQIHNQDPRRKYAVSEVKQIVYPLLSLLEEFDFHGVEGADEQAANISQPKHDPIACGDPSCDC